MSVPAAIVGNPTTVASNGWIVDIIDHSFTVLQSFRPEKLHFTKRIRAVEDIDFEVSNSARNFAGDLVVGRNISDDQDNFKPWKHMYQLRRLEGGVETKIMAGPITGTNMAKGRDSVKVYGKDWMEYLDHRQIPYDPRPTHVNDFRFGPTVDAFTPSVGFSYQVEAWDVAFIIDDILSVIQGRPHSLPLTWTLPATLVTTNFSLNLGDTSTALSIIDGLSEYWPGFDYRVSYDRAFTMWTPYRFGNADDTANDGPSGANIAYAFGDYYSHPVVDVDYTNTGPIATHLLGEGAGTGAGAVKATLGADDIQNGFWRLDGAVQFGDQAKSLGLTQMRTRKEFIFGAQEVHEINLTVDPQTVSDFWNVIRPGFAIWLREDLQMHELNSAQRVVSMECNVDDEWNEEVTLGLNQLYDTSDHYGSPEG